LSPVESRQRVKKLASAAASSGSPATSRCELTALTPLVCGSPYDLTAQCLTVQALRVSCFWTLCSVCSRARRACSNRGSTHGRAAAGAGTAASFLPARRCGQRRARRCCRKGRCRRGGERHGRGACAWGGTRKVRAIHFLRVFLLDLVLAGFGMSARARPKARSYRDPQC
jgi:hypothetical protein